MCCNQKKIAKSEKMENEPDDLFWKKCGEIKRNTTYVSLIHKSWGHYFDSFPM